MKTLTLREVLAPFLNKFAEPETLAPFFAVSLHQALLRKRLPAGMSERVAEAAFKRCVELESLYRACELPSPELWARDPLHPNVVRAAGRLSPKERAEIGSLVVSYLHGKPLASISQWWQAKADDEVARILTRFVGEDHADTPSRTAPGTLPECAVRVSPAHTERVLRYSSKGPRSRRTVEMIAEGGEP